MRLSRTRITAISALLLDHLLSEDLIESDQKKETIAATIATVITKELEVEDRLNREVEQVMKKYEREMRGSDVDAHAMFSMIKKQLVRERDIIL